MRRRPLLAVLLVVIALVATACSSGSSKSSSSTTPTTKKALSTTPGRGVTPTAVKIGFSLPDFKCITQFVNQIRPDNSPQIYQAFVDNVNKNGGAGGRQIEADIHVFCPIPTPQNLSVICPKFAQDDKVFAVVGNLFDPNGQAETCLAKQNNTPLQLFQLTKAITDKEPPGMVVFPGSFPERSDGALTQLLAKNHTFDGKKVAVLGEPGTKSLVQNSVEPELKKAGVSLGTTAIIGAGTNGTDTTNAQAQLDAVLERWKTEGVNAVFLTGNNATQPQFIEKVRKALPNVQLITDNGDTQRSAQDENVAGVKPNPYEGMITAGEPSDHDRIDSAGWKRCAAIYKEQMGQDAPNADSKIPYPGDAKKTLDVYGSISDACEQVTILKEILDKIGPNLNTDNWVNAVDNFGPINDPSSPNASLSQGKYDTNNVFQLQQFDSTIGPFGAYKGFGEPITSTS